MQITKLSYQVKNPDRVNVFVDGVYTFSLTTNEIIEQLLKVGLELDSARVKKLKKLSEDGKIRTRAQDWVLMRPHSIKEFNEYCYRKKIDGKLAETLKNELLQKDYLNDERYAEWLVGMRKAKHKSHRQINAELRQKGVNTETIQQVMNQTDVEQDDNDALSVLIKKLLTKSRYQNDQKKLVALLMQRGFSYQQIQSQLKDLPAEAD